MEQVRNFLLTEFRWAMNRQKLLGPFLNDVKNQDSLVEITANLESYPLKEYASYALTHLQRQGVDFSRYQNVFIDTLFKTDNQSVLRHLTNILCQMPLTDYRESELLDLLLSFVSDSKNKVALQVYSIYCLIQFVHKYPELEDEIRAVVMHNSKGKTPAYKIAVRNFNKNLSS